LARKVVWWFMAQAILEVALWADYLPHCPVGQWPLEKARYHQDLPQFFFFFTLLLPLMAP
jgi:hypothetical protein